MKESKPEIEPTYTIHDIATALQCSSEHVTELIRLGELIASNIGKGKQRARYAIKKSSFDDFMSRRSNESIPKRRRNRRVPKPTREWV